MSPDNSSNTNQPEEKPSDGIQDLNEQQVTDTAASGVKGGFNPQPDPPGVIRGFDPQPDPPAYKKIYPKPGY